MKKASSPSGAIGLIDPALARLDQGQKLGRAGRNEADRMKTAPRIVLGWRFAF
jgi:hypothetical protein